MDTQGNAGYPSANHMVAMGGYDSFVPTASTPLMATSSIASDKQFAIAKWRPRDGRTQAFQAMHKDMLALLAAFGVTEAQLSEEPPEVAVKNQIVTRQEDEAQLAEVQRKLVQQREVWHRINTAIYWHFRPALLLNGVHEAADEALVQSYVLGQRAHGRALIRWALSHADVTGEDKQSELYLRVAGARLRAEANQAQLIVHCQWMYEHWRLLSTSNATQLKSFYAALLKSMVNVNNGTSLLPWYGTG